MLCLNVVLALDTAELASPDSPPPPIFAVLLSFQSQEQAFQFYFFLSFTRLLKAVYHGNYERFFSFAALRVI